MTVVVQAHDLDEALARAQAFAEAGADVLFIDALESTEEMREFAALRGAAVPKMARCACLLLIFAGQVSNDCVRLTQDCTHAHCSAVHEHGTPAPAVAERTALFSRDAL